MKMQIGQQVWVYDSTGSPRRGTIEREGPWDFKDTWYVRDDYNVRLYSERSLFSDVGKLACEVRDTIDLLERWLRANEE